MQQENTALKSVKEKLQVRHYAQVPCEPFCFDVDSEREAFRIIQALSKQHLFLFQQRIIPDFANVFSVVMWDETMKEWTDYWNEEESMEWDEVVDAYFEK